MGHMVRVIIGQAHEVGTIIGPQPLIPYDKDCNVMYEGTNIFMDINIQPLIHS